VDVVAIELDPVGDEGVDGRGDNFRGGSVGLFSMVPDVGPSPIVDQDEQDVGERWLGEGGKGGKGGKEEEEEESWERGQHPTTTDGTRNGH